MPRNRFNEAEEFDPCHSVEAKYQQALDDLNDALEDVAEYGSLSGVMLKQVIEDMSALLQEHFPEYEIKE